MIDTLTLKPVTKNRLVFGDVFKVGSLKKNHCILIADRNPNVREFLKRELTAEGYRIKIAGSCAEVIRSAYANNLIDVIILDPDLPGDTDATLIKRLRSRVPAIPLIIHALNQDMASDALTAGREIFVEKQANSIEQLKKIVNTIIHPL